MENQPKKIKQAFILCAGLGTRLRPLTNTVPKMMLEIAPGKPLLQHEIELLRSQGITDFVINLHYLPEVITSYFGDGKKFGVNIVYSDERAGLLETGGALSRAKPLLDDEFLFLYGDHLFFFDFTPVIAQHEARQALATLVLKTSDLPENGEVLEFDADSRRILRSFPRPHDIKEFTSTCMLNSGLFVLSKKILDFIPADTAIKLDAEIIPRLIKQGEALYAFPTAEPILDIGAPDKYEYAKQYYKTMTKASFS